MMEAVSLIILATALLNSVTVSAELLADGGGLNRTAPCTDPWNYKLGSGGDLIPLTGCVSFDDFKPWPIIDNANLDQVFAPLRQGTDLTRWCSTTSNQNRVYNPRPANLPNRVEWGYCHDTTTATPAPTPSTTAAPVAEPAPSVTPAPTAKQTTAAPAPTPKPTTSAPTQFYLQADGGFVASGTTQPCLENWQYKAGQGATNEDVQGCVSFDKYKPWPYYTDESTDSIIEPSNPSTNLSSWCSLRTVYNPAPALNPENRLQWGFCLDLRTVPTPAPTTLSPSNSETPATTASPTPETTGTPAPSSSFTGVPTSADQFPTIPPPTDDDGNPVPNGQSGSSNDDVNVGAAVGVPIAIIALLGVIAALFVFKRRQRNQGEQQNQNNGGSGSTFAQRLSSSRDAMMGKFQNGKEMIKSKFRNAKTGATTPEGQQTSPDANKPAEKESLKGATDSAVPADVEKGNTGPNMQ